MRRMTGWVAPILCAVLAVGCGSDDQKNTSAAPGTTGTSSPTVTAAVPGNAGTSAANGDAQLSGVLRVGAPMSLSGPGAYFGEGERAGMEFAADEINQSGFLGGATIELKFEDVAASVDQAVTVSRGFMEDDSTSAMAGMTLSAHSLAVAPLAQQSGMPFVVVNSGGLRNLADVGDRVYSIDPPPASYGKKLVSALTERGVKTLAIITDPGSPANVDMTAAFEDSLLPAGGIEVVSKDEATSGDADFSAVVSNAAAVEADAVGIFMTGAACVTIIEALRQAGYEGEIFSHACLAGGAAVAGAPATEGVLFLVSSSPLSPEPSSQAFFKAYEAKTGKAAGTPEAQGYDAVWLIARAAAATGCLDRDCITEGLAQVASEGFDGALGALTFDGRVAVAPGVVLAIKDGKEALVG
jgi:branched-chain amino acid transport system substrate-binding protein